MNPSTDRARGFPAALISSIWSPTSRSARGWALTAVIVNVLITVTGAAVRVTGSGLGCPTWPQCTADSFVPVPHDEISPVNMAIEFGNRLLTFLVLLVAVACVVAATRLPSRRPDLVRLAWLQPIGVAVQGLWGGLVVHTLLNPFTVSMHFLFSVAMTAAAYVLYIHAREEDGPVRPLVHRGIRALGTALVVAVSVLLVAGVVVTGTGPHSGDELASRFPFDIEAVTRIHVDIAYVVVGLTFALLFALYVTDGPVRARWAALALLGVELAQGGIGYVQYFLGVPATLVNLHVLGSALVWIGTLHVVFALRARDPRDAPAETTGPLDAVRG
ncbi:cytochrome c oxidase assembly protein subunit 15 [Streptosporangium becharense]|uniref:Cytochrome c oxidase assembly protein subunit 15 n=1 Tax=Streptosporangium becharense TaxID=1816182 RepID=A0A7W9IC24_9ACTN|nr:COX15/CtaA family protein [Streptosporangium becharense]MBB2915218.1 cytochrome c oxidase assembly protein subunit 15 [Streptosporangium becharense]MBB5817953.1 cytochrome c oxidase assembly protein subunit 15 [Streptosporangium becharense]